LESEQSILQTYWNAYFCCYLTILKKAKCRNAVLSKSTVLFVESRLSKNQVKVLILEARANDRELKHLVFTHIWSQNHWRLITTRVIPISYSKHSAFCMGALHNSTSKTSYVGLGGSYIGCYYFSNSNEQKWSRVDRDRLFGYDMTKPLNFLSTSANLFGKEDVAGLGVSRF